MTAKAILRRALVTIFVGANVLIFVYNWTFSSAPRRPDAERRDGADAAFEPDVDRSGDFGNGKGRKSQAGQTSTLSQREDARRQNGLPPTDTRSPSIDTLERTGGTKAGEVSNQGGQSEALSQREAARKELGSGRADKVSVATDTLERTGELKAAEISKSIASGTSRAAQSSRTAVESVPLMDAHTSSKGDQERAKVTVITFARGQYRLDASSKVALLGLFNRMSLDKQITVRINGYADGNRDVVKDGELSIRRAQAVAEYLVQLGVPQERLTVQGLGSIEAPPRARPSKAEERQGRVEIIEDAKQ